MHGLEWGVGSDIVPQRQAFDGKTVFFSALRRIFSKFRWFCERVKAVLIPVRHCVRQALFPSSPFVLTDVCAGFWRQIKEASGASRFFGDVCEGSGRRLKDSAGETVSSELT